MNNSGLPTYKVSTVWAAAASSSNVRIPPVASQIPYHPGWASFNDGFPPLNFAPVASGGIPPFGQDTNGILKIITSWTNWYLAGAPLVFDSTFATAIGGYPKGAIVSGNSNQAVQWLSLIDANTQDPENYGLNLAQWASQTQGRLLRVSIYGSPGTYGFTPLYNTNKIRVFAVGGGASGCGCSATSSSTNAVGSGGASGSYGSVQLAAPQFTPGTVTITVTIGAGGTGTNAGANPGTATSFGAFLGCPGGNGGGYINISATGAGVASQGLPAAVPGVGLGGTTIFASRGNPGQCGVIIGGSPMSGMGGPGPFGGAGTNTANTAAGGQGVTYGAAGGPGAGGGGAASQVSAAACVGGNGAAGWMMIEEYSA